MITETIKTEEMHFIVQSASNSDNNHAIIRAGNRHEIRENAKQAIESITDCNLAGWNLDDYIGFLSTWEPAYIDVTLETPEGESFDDQYLIVRTSIFNTP